MKKAKKKAKKQVRTLTHPEARRPNIPTAEVQAVMDKEEQTPVRVVYGRRNRDLDPQLVWRGKDEQDWSELVVHAPPLYIQEKVHPKALIDDLVASGKQRAAERQPDLFADFNGLPDAARGAEFYRHDANWTNRMILGDSLHVMASLAEREGLRGQVQCIYLDPPYGIKFNSNFQWSTTSRDVKDGKASHITREPEQVKAFRDTWRDGIHSYLTYLRDRLTVARDLLTESGSIFVQIGDENVHRVRAVMDEVFGEGNYVVTLKFSKTTGLGGKYVDETFDYIIWSAKSKSRLKFRRLYLKRVLGGSGATQYKYVMSPPGVTEARNAQADDRLFSHGDLTSQTGNRTTTFGFLLNGHPIAAPRKGGWKTNKTGMDRLVRADRLVRFGNTPRYVRYFDDSSYYPLGSAWLDTNISGFGDDKVYVVQTLRKVVERCILMTTDPGDLVLDPTCGSGTTAYVAEQWGRRWITIDTSRVALALARARLMGARHPYYLLADSPEGQRKEAELTGKAPSETPTYGNIQHGFVYDRVPHITLKSIANNAEIDVIHEQYQNTLEPLRDALNAALQEQWQEWEIPRQAGESWPAEARRLHAEWWKTRTARQQAIDASIAAKADYEYLYDKPHEDKSKVRVAGPFTVESLSPHRVLAVDEDDELIGLEAGRNSRRDQKDETRRPGETDFAAVILEHLRTAGVQQAHKEDTIRFSAVTGWPGRLVCAEGRYVEGDAPLPDPPPQGEREAAEQRAAPPPHAEGEAVEKRAGIFIGPEFGTVSRADLVAAAREAGEAGFDSLIACAFNYDAHSAEFDRLGRLPVLKARMNADLHMADDLKNTGAGNLFVIFGEPDIDLLEAEDGTLRVRLNGVDVFHPTTGEVRSDGPEGIACWFLDTDYNEESFFVRHAYFLGANDPYTSLKTTLKAEIDPDAWAALHSDTSRPFAKPPSGRLAVKVINHLGDEVMKVFRV